MTIINDLYKYTALKILCPLSDNFVQLLIIMSRSNSVNFLRPQLNPVIFVECHRLVDGA